MKKVSSGILIYKIKDDKAYFFIVHPGGPYWKGKDEGTWSIPKGEIDDSDFSQKAMLKNAIKEVKEETGISLPDDSKHYLPLGEITQKSGKVVHAWAYEGDWSGILMCHSYATIEYPSRSGKMIKIPEVDKAGFFTEEETRKKINPAQAAFIDRLKHALM